jgi:CubicO group peptidase (beta-lactamase class C family)
MMAAAFAALVVGLLLELACSGINREDQRTYEPLQLEDWDISTPEAEGLDPDLVLSTYQKANSLSTLYSLLIIKNNRLVAEKYFNGTDVYTANSTASITKSIVSSLAGIALCERLLANVDQKIMTFFPEIDWTNLDSRKSQISIRQVLQMRSGFPWEEFTGYFERLRSSSNWIPLIEEIPLFHDPGGDFGYSNFTTHLMGIIVARAANADLRSFAQTRLFDALDCKIGYWPADALGYYYGSGDLSMTPRNMAKYGSLYLNSGEFNGLQIIPSKWVSASLAPSSFNVYGPWVPSVGGKIFAHFDVLDYGYLWWSSKAGSHPVTFAWGQGGQFIVLVPDLSMLVVTSAYHFPGKSGDLPWQKTKAIMELVGGFIESIE